MLILILKPITMKKIKAKSILFFKYFFFVLFIGYYASITLFFHSHFVNGITISHSHPYWEHNDAKGFPIKHSHTKNELGFIQLVTHFLSLVAVGFLSLGLIIVLLSKYQIKPTETALSLISEIGYSLRGPPFKSISINKDC